MLFLMCHPQCVRAETSYSTEDVKRGESVPQTNQDLEHNRRGTRVCTNGTCGIKCASQYPTQCGDTTAGESICANLNGDILNWCAAGGLSK